jgi:ABC-type Na+ transport system ATPase subunit NatA
LLKFFDEVGLRREAAINRVSTYSKGMRQKVGISIALAKKAEVLLLDEPTSGLDPESLERIFRTVEKIIRKRLRRADGDARPFSGERIRHESRHYEARTFDDRTFD